MKSVFKSSGLFAAALMLASCGSESNTPDLVDQLVATAKSTLEQRKNRNAPQAAAAVTRAQVEQSTVPLIRLTVGATGSQATAAELARNGDTATYLMGTGQAIYLRGGLMTGTRGLGYDLMALDMPYRSVAEALKGGSYTRVHRYLDNENKTLVWSATCSMQITGTKTLTQLERQYKVRQVVETCQGAEMSFVNTYDLDVRSKQVWQSRQWVGPVAEHARIEQLKP